MTELLLGIRSNLADKMKVVKMSDIDLKNKVEQLRISTAKQIDLDIESFGKFLIFVIY